MAPTPVPDAVRLREEMISKLRAAGAVRSPHVEAALNAVDRHAFAPEAALEDVYDPERVVVTKRDQHGVALSSVSAADIQARMLEQARLRPGMRVLEVGSGGVNAALIREIVGSGGQVTTCDIDPFVTDRATRLLAAAGYEDIRVVLGDGEEVAADHAPDGGWDAIIITVGAWDIPPAWRTHLAPHGRLVLPLRMRGFTRCLALTRDGEHLTSESMELAGFVAMQGAGSHTERLICLHGEEVGLRVDDGDAPDPQALSGVLAVPQTHVWSGVSIGGMTPFDTLQLYLTTLPGFCLLSLAADADTDLVNPSHRNGAPAMVAGDSLAYLTLRKINEAQRVFEFGVHAFGTRAEELAKTMTDRIHTWDRDHRHGAAPRVTVVPAGTPAQDLPAGHVLDKRHSRLIISWP